MGATSLRPFLPVIAVAVFLLVLASPVSAAENPFCLPGSAAGECSNPQGIATDFETGHVYVADKGNNRVDVFQSDGTSLGAIGSGQLTAPAWVAVDNDPSSASRHDIWVTTEKGDGAELLIKKFAPNGNFIEADSFGAPAKEGTGECEFKANDPIAVGPDGDVYVADHFETAPSQFKSRVERFDPEGNCLGEVALFEGPDTITGLGVDPAGDSYVTTTGSPKLRKYGAEGTLLYELGVSDTEAKNAGAIATEPEAVALDSSGDVFTRQRGQQLTKSALTNFFTEYDPSGAVLKRFGYLLGQFGVFGLAAFESSTGDLFVNLGAPGFGSEGISYLKLPSPGPVVMPEPCSVKAGALGNDKAILQAEVNPEGKATTVHYEFISDEDFVANGNSFSGTKPPSDTVESGSIGSDFNMHEADVQAEVIPETKYRCRVVATNADGSGTGQEGTFTTRPAFEIGQTTVSGVGIEEASLNATVNPIGIQTTGFFEYVEEATYLKDIEELGLAHGFDHATRAPEDGSIDFGAGEGFVTGSAVVSGLKPATVYRFRVVVTDAKIPAPIVGPTEAFRTFGGDGQGLADQRAWELVSPDQKNNAEVGMLENPGGLIPEPRFVRIQAGSGSGEAVTYTSWTSFGDAEGAPSSSQYLSRRTSDGWQTQNISPRGFIADGLMPAYNGFTPDLGFGLFKTTEPVLTADCREVHGEDLYLRDNQTGALRCLDPAVANGPEPQCLVYGGMSEDGSVFVAGKPEGGEAYTYNLYQLTADGEFHLISVLPNGEAAAPTQGTSFGPSDSFVGSENCQFTRTVLRHAVSSDGTKVFWTYVPEIAANEPSQLLVRVDGSETRQLDAVQSGGGKAGGGIFRGASANGSVAYFTDTERLVSGAKANAREPDLYRYDVGSAKPLTDVTKGEVAGDVKGVVGASDDGSYVYFVAGAVLGEAGAKSLSGETPTAGENNLYVYHEGQTHFIAILSAQILSAQDVGDWSAEPRGLSARVSPDGRHLAFLSTEAQALAGYENTIATGEHCQYQLTIEHSLELVGSPKCPEAFIYDAENEKLTCASCNPSGSRPLGPTVLPGWTNGFEGPRYLSDDGDRLFFESLDALLPADTNNKMDVYEFETAGDGSCTSQDSAFDPASGGCHSLISSGTSKDESYLIDASSNGRDVFFSTREQLVGWDANANFDIYDARVGGGFPGPPPAPHVCEGEECHSAPVAAAPVLGMPGSLAFTGPGNLFSPPQPSPSRPKATVRTRAQELTAALKACRAKHNKHKRIACERQARKHYGRSATRSTHKSLKGGK